LALGRRLELVHHRLGELPRSVQRFASWHRTGLRFNNGMTIQLWCYDTIRFATK
jgi:hypothetical protein